MTIQNIQPEHNDVDTSVVEHQSVSETTTPPPSLDVVAPSETETQNHEQSEQHASQVQEEEKSFDPASTNQDVEAFASVEPTTVDAESEHEPVVEITPSFSSESIPAIEDEEVRPFTDFIEEFRQAEARYTNALQEAQPAESLSLLAPSVEPYTTEFIPPWADTPSTTLPEIAHVETEVVAPIEGTQTQFIAPITHAEGQTVVPVEEKSEDLKTAITTPVEDVENQFIVPIIEETVAPQVEAPETTPTPTTPSVRPVSPLLRPSLRPRMPRHGSGRHREETIAEAAPLTETQEQSQVETVTAPTEITPVVEQPRPARRYRFDRRTPADVPAPTATVPPLAEENKDAASRVTNGQAQTVEHEIQPTQQTKAVVNTAQQTEQAGPKQPAVQENPVTEHTTPDNDRRRRHGQDRQHSKEASTPPTSTGADIAVVLNAQPTLSAGAEPVALPVEEVNLEDLPPLEYSELQKANTRRRRRRPTGSTPVPAATTNTPLPTPIKSIVSEPPVTPTPTPSTAVARPSANTPAPVVQTPYTITSGYTVNQMNQKGDGSTPFMGPEPSPARGSIAAQNVRSIRTDIQRTPAYPVRTTEATSASVHQLANIVSQAIQTQTDRMVTELRRANQSPTSVSVSLPPFPSNERVGVFVDVANLLYSARTLRMTVDFGKLLDFLRGNRRLIRAQAYCPTSPQAGDEQMFLQAVKGLGYRITTKNYKTFSSGAKKADLDLDLCMDVVRLVDGKAVDCIVLVSGDSDFMPMLDYCSDHGVRVEVAAFDEAMSATLRQGCDLFINLSMLDEIRV